MDIFINQNISSKDKIRLRELAKKQLESAESPEMEIIYKRQWDVNNGTGGTCPVIRIETDGLSHELVSDDLLECESSPARNIEYRLLYNILHYKLTGDDRIIPKTYPIEWLVNIDPYGFEIQKDIGKDNKGLNIGYHINHIIRSISDDFRLLKPLTVSVNRDLSENHRSFVNDMIGDILPAEMIGWPKGVTFLTRSLLDLISMEDMYTALYDEPDQIHRLMEYLLNNAFILMDFYEKEQIMSLNNGAAEIGNSSYPLTDLLPAPNYNGVPRMKDMFLRTDSQETLSISPSMFGDFFLPYYKRLCQKAGLWYYGCCEPVHNIWENHISKITNIKKVSISKWCDEEIMGSHLKNKPVVYSRKFDALFLGKDSGFDADGFTEYIKNTMRFAEGCQIEFLSREVPSFYGNIKKLKTAVEIFRSLTC